MTLNTIPTTDLFDTMWPLLLTSLVAAGVPLVPWLLTPSMASLEDLLSLFSTLVQSPFRVFALSETFPEVFFFLFEQLRITAHSFGPMGEGVDYTKLGREVMVVIPL